MLARGLCEQRAHLLVGRLREVLVPQPDRVERVGRDRADDLIDLAAKLLAGLGRRRRHRDDDLGRS